MKKKTLTPIFNEEFIIDWADDDSHITVEVFDHDEVMGVNHTNEFIGKVSIPIGRLSTHKPEGPKYYKLRNEHNKTDTKNRGQIHLMLQWIFDVHAKPEMRSKRGGLLGGLVKDDDETDDDEDDKDVEDEPKTEEQIAAEKKAREEAEAAEKALKETISGFEIQSGDYQIQARIICPIAHARAHLRSLSF